jgi:hypothetical protein
MIIGISGSATPDSSTDILVKEVLRGVTDDKNKKRFFRLNEMRILPCQACGKSPEPDYCFFHDDAYQLLHQIARAWARRFISIPFLPKRNYLSTAATAFVPPIFQIAALRNSNSPD